MAIDSVGTSYAASVSAYSQATERPGKDATSEQSVKSAADSGVVYEKSDDSSKTKDTATYSINQMSSKDRTAIASQMKADANRRAQQLVDLVQKTLSGQVGAFGKATGDDFWKKLASGDFTVDEATRKQAEDDIGEDGYWGVKQTSQRLFDFASALAGDDPEKMKQMQEAMQKGFDEATKAWGRDLPGISSDTLSAANKLFEDYYNSKN